MKYLLTSNAWPGEIEIVYNDLQLLVSHDTSRADLSENQQLWFLKNLPRELCELQQLIDKSTSATLTEVKDEITFDKFWIRYDEKLRSSKKKALKVWNRLSEADQIKAYKFISKYEQSIRDGVAKKYAETYLNAELWNN
jgi:hypothetical protein